jgi:Secretion system C-terminal sorting domain
MLSGRRSDDQIANGTDFVHSLFTFSIPMKKLPLWLAFVCLSNILMGQSPGEQPAAITDPSFPFSFFTVTQQNGHAVLRWSAPPVKSEDFFIVEKSSDALHFDMLSAIDASVGTDSVYSVVDNAVGTGTISYRIRISGKDGKESYSRTVNMNSTTDADFRFYPNPVDKLLIIRSSHALSVQVQDAFGVIWFAQDVDAGMQIVNVSALQKGSYILKATDKSTNAVISEQLVKNN